MRPVFSIVWFLIALAAFATTARFSTNGPSGPLAGPPEPPYLDVTDFAQRSWVGTGER